MATSKLAPIPFPAQAPQTITSEQISRYAELTSLLSGLEAQQKALRSQLLDLHTSGAEQQNGCPYTLAFIDQERRTIDWKALSLHLAEKLYGVEGASTWKDQVEAAAPVQLITQVRVKPNTTFAAGLKPAVPIWPTVSVQ